MTELNKVISILNAYRIHVIALFFLLIALPLHFNTTGQASNDVVAITLLGFTSLWASYYIGNKYVNYQEDIISQPTEARRSKTLLYAVMCMALVPLVFFFLHSLPLWPYVVMLCITLGYSVPVYEFRFKKHLVIKNVYAAGSWWLAASFVHVYYLFPFATLSDALLYNAPLFALILIIELLWNIQNIEEGAVASTGKNANFFGVTVVKMIILSLLLAMHTQNDPFPSFNIATINLIYLAAISIFVKPGFPAYFFHSVIYFQIVYVMTVILMY